MGLILLKIIKFWLFQKVEKIPNKIVKFGVENFEHLCWVVKFEFENFELRNIIKNETGPPLSYNLHKIGANLYNYLAYNPFFCKKVWS